MAIPATAEELRAFIVATIEEQQAASLPGPLPQPNVPDAAELWRARDAIARADGVVELLRQREQTMAASEEEVKSKVQSLREKLEEDLLAIQTQYQDFVEKINATFTKQDEATEEAIGAAQREIMTEQAKALQQTNNDIASKIIEQQATVSETLRTTKREARKEIADLRERLDKAERALPPGIQQQQQPQQQQQRQSDATVGSAAPAARPPTSVPAASTGAAASGPAASAGVDIFDIFSPAPPAPAAAPRDPWANAARTLDMDQNRSTGEDRGKKHHVTRVELHKIDLTTIADDKKYLAWRKKFDMEVDDIWNGLERVLKEIRLMKEPCTALRFEQLMAIHAVRPNNFEPIEWKYDYVGKQMYRILFKRMDGNFNNIVMRCESDRDGVEAYRLLSKHCDPHTFNTAGALMEAITELGNKKAGSVDELLNIMHEMKKRLATYKERVKPLPDARTTWIPSTLVGLMDRECLTYVRKAQASEDFSKMLAAIEELREINKSVKVGSSLRAMKEEEQEQEEEGEEEMKKLNSKIGRKDRRPRRTSC